MMVDRRARGYFHRAIADAGYGTWPFPQAMNLSPEQRAKAPPLGKQVSPAVLVKQVPHFHLPVVGGSDLPQQPARLFEAGKQAKVPLVAGANSFDGHQTIDGAGYGASGMAKRYGGLKQVRSVYAKDFAVSELQAMSRLFGDMRYMYSAWKAVRSMRQIGQPGYLFYYDAPSPGLPGAPHGAHYHDLFSSRASPLKAYWLSYIRTGKLAPDNLPAWLAHTEDRPMWMVFSPNPQLQEKTLNPKMTVIEDLPLPKP